jgi:hypothetical protein
MEKSGAPNADQRAQSIRCKIAAIIAAPTGRVNLVKFIAGANQHHHPEEQQADFQCGPAVSAEKCQAEQTCADGEDRRVNDFVRPTEGKRSETGTGDGGQNEKRHEPCREGEPKKDVFSVPARGWRVVARCLLRVVHLFRRRSGWKGLAMKFWGRLLVGITSRAAIFLRQAWRPERVSKKQRAGGCAFLSPRDELRFPPAHDVDKAGVQLRLNPRLRRPQKGRDGWRNQGVMA